ncbi:mitochondrial ribosomal small subunit component [Pseudogymnoascus australis]
MGRYNLTATRVHHAASRLIELRKVRADAGMLQSTPPWFKTVSAVPPGEILTRTQPIQHSDFPRKIRTKKPSKMYKPTNITYEEDGLRENFYSDHPWELARPRVILEQDGKDGQKSDWSKIQQPNRELNGESVIQRQLWLLKNEPNMTSAKAYDQARKEFYAIRHEEDVERRVAKEEALATGAYFGKSMLEIGMELEDKTYESWKEWAAKEVEIIEQQRSAQYTGAELAPAEEAVIEEALEETVEAPAPL